MHESTAVRGGKEKAMWGTTVTVQQFKKSVKPLPLKNQHDTTLVDGEGRVDNIDDMQETVDSLGSRSPPAASWSSLPSSSSLYGAPWHPFTPPAPIARHGILKPAWLWRKQRSTAIRTSCLYLTPENDIPRPFFYIKNAPDRHQPLQNKNFPTKQRAPRSQKRTGVETTLKTTRIEHQGLHRFRR